MTATWASPLARLTAATGVSALGNGFPIVAWADAVGPRRVTVLMFALAGLAVAGHEVVHPAAAFVAVAVAATVGLAGSNAARGALPAGLLGAQEATHARSLIRSAANLGIALGALAAGVILTSDSRSGYLAMLGIDVLTFAIAATLCLTLPAVIATRGEHLRWSALRDGRYLAVAAASGVLAVHYGVVTVALPRWVVTAMVMTGVVITFGAVGWCALGLLLAGAGLLTPPLVRRALPGSAGPAYPDDTVVIANMSQ